MSLATEQGKEAALKALKERKEKNRDREKVDNSKLYAGSPMYYYCKACGEEIVLPETHICPAPSLCRECHALKDCGWLE